MLWPPVIIYFNYNFVSEKQCLVCNLGRGDKPQPPLSWKRGQSGAEIRAIMNLKQFDENKTCHWAGVTIEQEFNSELI